MYFLAKEPSGVAEFSKAHVRCSLDSSEMKDIESTKIDKPSLPLFGMKMVE